MIKFRELYERANIYFTVKDLINWKTGWNDQTQRSLDFYIDYYYKKSKKEKDEALKFIVDIINEVLTIVYQRVKFYKFGYFHEKDTINSILDDVLNYMETKPYKVDMAFPIPIYVSVDKNDKNTIGLLLYKNGKLEYFEGNDEASSETVNMVNKAMNPKPKFIQIYASHDEKIVKEIERTKKLPKNLYVSPYKKHAEAYWSLDEIRYLFTGKIDIRDVSQESDIDWKTIVETKIKDFKYL